MSSRSSHSRDVEAAKAIDLDDEADVGPYIPCDQCGSLIRFSDYERHIAMHAAASPQTCSGKKRFCSSYEKACSVCMCNLEGELLLTTELLNDVVLQGLDDEAPVAAACPQGHPIHMACLGHARRAAAADGKGAVTCAAEGCGLPFGSVVQRLGATFDEQKQMTENALQAMLSDAAIPCPWPSCQNYIMKADIPQRATSDSASSSSTFQPQLLPPAKRRRAAVQPGVKSPNVVELVSDTKSVKVDIALSMTCIDANCPSCHRAFCAACGHFPAHPQIPECGQAAIKRQEWDDAVLIYEAAEGDEDVRKAAIERRSGTLRLRVIDEILTTRCPKCRRAFIDFDGCFALSCHCGCSFCGWCLQECGKDAHPHVITCRHGLGLFGTFGSFTRAQNRMRDAALKTFFQNLPSDEMRSALADAIKKDLDDLGLSSKDYSPRNGESLWQRVRLGALSALTRPNRIFSSIYNRMVPPKALPSQKIEKTDAACACCGEVAYLVRWTCACCIAPVWHVCGQCVDSKGPGALCQGEGHWLFRHSQPPRSAEKATLSMLDLKTLRCGDLKEHLRHLGASTAGNKAALADRLSGMIKEA